eukprot:750072-Hanusia_phi.AAC.1
MVSVEQLSGSKQLGILKIAHTYKIRLHHHPLLPVLADSCADSLSTSSSPPFYFSCGYPHGYHHGYSHGYSHACSAGLTVRDGPTALIRMSDHRLNELDSARHDSAASAARRVGRTGCPGE